MAAASLGDDHFPNQPPPSDSSDSSFVIAVVALASFICLLLLVGLGVTYHEFKRLSVHSEASVVQEDEPWIVHV